MCIYRNIDTSHSDPELFCPIRDSDGLLNILFQTHSLYLIRERCGYRKLGHDFKYVSRLCDHTIVRHNPRREDGSDMLGVEYDCKLCNALISSGDWRGKTLTEIKSSMAERFTGTSHEHGTSRNSPSRPQIASQSKGKLDEVETNIPLKLNMELVPSGENGRRNESIEAVRPTSTTPSTLISNGCASAQVSQSEPACTQKPTDNHLRSITRSEMKPGRFSRSCIPPRHIIPPQRYIPPSLAHSSCQTPIELDSDDPESQSDDEPLMKTQCRPQIPGNANDQGNQQELAQNSNNANMIPRGSNSDKEETFQSTNKSLEIQNHPAITELQILAEKLATEIPAAEHEEIGRAVTDGSFGRALSEFNTSTSPISNAHSNTLSPESTSTTTSKSHRLINQLKEPKNKKRKVSEAFNGNENEDGDENELINLRDEIKRLRHINVAHLNREIVLMNEKQAIENRVKDLLGQLSQELGEEDDDEMNSENNQEANEKGKPLTPPNPTEKTKRHDPHQVQQRKRGKRVTRRSRRIHLQSRHGRPDYNLNRWRSIWTW